MAPRRRGGLVQLRDGNQLDVETALRQYGLPAPPHFRTVKLLPL
jgi:hypothetical protein